MTAVRQLPSTPLAPNMASAISTGQVHADSWVRNAETTSEPSGSWLRLCTFVLAQPVKAA